MKQTLQKILVVRNDKLGDFMLAFPSFALLKQSLPDTEIHALVPAYTQALAEQCAYIDYCITDPGEQNGIGPLLTLIRQQNYDAVIALYSTSRVGFCALFSGIRYRLAPATKIAQIFYNHRLRQRRSRSEKPEYVYNLDLVKKLLLDFAVTIKQRPESPFLNFEHDVIDTTRKEFCQNYSIAKELPIVFIHPGSGGSANNLNIKQYAEIAKVLQLSHQLSIVISSGPGEEQTGEKMSKLLTNTPHIHYRSTEGLVRFAQHINMADLFISGSTGPLHIAGALDIATVGFYPRRRSATALRWQTLNSENNRLAISPPTDADEADMSCIDIKDTVNTILKYYARLFSSANQN